MEPMKQNAQPPEESSYIFTLWSWWLRELSYNATGSAVGDDDAAISEYIYKNNDRKPIYSSCFYSFLENRGLLVTAIFFIKRRNQPVVTHH